MIISHKYSFIFIHIPKCAGTSITRALLPYLGEEDVVFGCTPELEQKSSASLAQGGLFKHSAAREIKQVVDPSLWQQYYKFSFVRNPWDAVLSRYYWWQKNAPGWSDEVLQTTVERSGLNLGDTTIEDLTFPHFVAAIDDFSRYPYSVFIDAEDGSSYCDFIGRYECLEQDFDAVCAHLQIEDVLLPLTNTSAEMRSCASYAQEYDADSARTVGRVFASEIAKFGYVFGR